MRDWPTLCSLYRYESWGFRSGMCPRARQDKLTHTSTGRVTALLRTAGRGVIGGMFTKMWTGWGWRQFFPFFLHHLSFVFNECESFLHFFFLPCLKTCGILIPWPGTEPRPHQWKKGWNSNHRRKWQPTPVFLPGESQGWGSLVGRHLWGHTESDTTEAT